jgi:hypothetical protein
MLDGQIADRNGHGHLRRCPGGECTNEETPELAIPV